MSTKPTPRSAIRERRRTLHTISELSPHSPISVEDIDSTPTPQSNEQHIIKTAASSVAKKRRSLPTHGRNIGYDNRRNPAILVTPTDPPVPRRAFTDPNRLSARSVASVRHQQDPPLLSIAEGAKPQARSCGIPAFPLPPQSHQAGAQKTTPNNATIRCGDDWDRRRELDRLKREQAIIAAKARREKEGLVTVGSAPSLPSLSPYPVVKAKEVHVARKSSQKLNHPLNQPIQVVQPRSLPNRRSSLRNMPEHMESKPADRLAVKRASLSALAPTTPERSAVRKRRSEASEPNQLYNSSEVSRSSSQRTNVSSSELYPTFMSQNRYQRGRSKSSTSLSPSPNSTSSTNLPGVSRGSSLSRPTSSSRTSLSSHHYTQQEAGKGQMEVFPTLIDMIPPAGSGISRVPTTAPPLESRRSSLGSQTSRRASLNRNSFQSAQQSQLRGRSHLPAGIVHRKDLDKRGSRTVAADARGPQVLKKREQTESAARGASVVDLEKAAREKAREKVRERVRRANELEEEKEKELLKLEKKKRLSYLCGLFGD